MDHGLPPSDPRSQQALRDYAVLDPSGGDGEKTRTDIAGEFDEIVRFAAVLCGTQTAFVSFVGDDTQWFGAKQNLDLDSTPRALSFCAFTTAGPNTLVVPDSRLDARFRDNPLVTGEPFIRFYAGVPLRTPEGVALGALCVLDTHPRAGLSPMQVMGLETLAAQVMARLDARRRDAWRSRVQDTIVSLTAETGFANVLDVSVEALAAAQLDKPDDSAGQVAGFGGLPLSRLLRRIEPADLDALRAALRTARQSGDDIRAEFRATGRHDASRVMLLRGRVLNDAGMHPRLVGVITDVTEQRGAERASAESETRFRILADTMPQMVWSTRPDGFHDYYNARWYEFTGVPEGSTDGEEWNGMFHSEDQERAWAAWRHSLATGAPYEIEYRLRHRSGQYRWVLGRALPMRDAAGAIIRWFGTCTDIHDAKSAAEERELVAQELSHRIKNTFLVISGLISLYARSDPAMKPFADEMRERIAALGRAHNFVRPHSRYSRPSRIAVTLLGLIRDLVAPYELRGERRVSVTGDDLRIHERAATPLALLFHELATNATKYGALSAPGGRIEVTSRVEADTVTLSWVERDGPPVPAGTPADGFGTRISRLSVEAQMGGTIARAWDAAGLRVVATVPLLSIAERGEGRAAARA